VIPQLPLSPSRTESTFTLTLYPQHITDWLYKITANPEGRKLLGY
jgi:hypothetical protein